MARLSTVRAVLTGKHQDEVGYYEDDEADKAIVYLGEFFTSDCILVRRGDLENVDARSIHLERWKRAYPWLVKSLGAP